MKIENLKIREVQDKGSLKAYIQATINELSINDIKLMDGQNGMFISMPSRKYQDQNGNDKYSDIVFLTKEQKGELLQAVLHQMNGQAPDTRSNSEILASAYTSTIPDDAFADFGETVELSEDDIAF